MYTMYIDDSGSSTLTDNSRFYLLAGIVVKNEDIKKIQKAIFEFKYDNFKGSYMEAEIHTHDLYRNKNEFIDLSNGIEKHKLLKRLYTTIGNLPITVISSCIDKPEMKKQHPEWKIFKMAWVILAYKFNQYLDSFMTEKGIMKIDKSSSKEQNELNNIIKDLRRENKKHKRIENIICEPFFAHSGASEGIQIADAISFCITKRLHGNKKFPSYWDDIIHEKMYNKDGKIFGYGLNIFPKMDKIPSEDIQP